MILNNYVYSNELLIIHINISSCNSVIFTPTYLDINGIKYSLIRFNTTKDEKRVACFSIGEDWLNYVVLFYFEFVSLCLILEVCLYRSSVM